MITCVQRTIYWPFQNCKKLCSITNTLLYIKCSIRWPLIKRYISLEPLTFRFKQAILSISFYAPDGTQLNRSIYFILSSEINANQKQIKVISFTSEMLYFHCSVFGLPPTFFHSLNAFHFRTSNAHNFLICEQKHQVWVSIFLVRTWQIFWYQIYLGLLRTFIFAFSAPPFSVGETLHIAYKNFNRQNKFRSYLTRWHSNSFKQILYKYFRVLVDARVTRTHSMARHRKSPRSHRNLMVIDPLTPPKGHQFDCRLNFFSVS